MEQEQKSIKIAIAAHKEYRMPHDVMYIPVFAGAALSDNIPEGYTGDDTGDNISELNPSFCELTVLYWAWKNIEAEYIGLVHYRRYFSIHKKKNPWKSILKYDQIEKYLGNVLLFIPKKRRYYIETLYSHYAHTHYAGHLKETARIIKKFYPEYYGSYMRILNRRWGYMFNMMIMKRSYLDEYCTWLFDILFKLRPILDKQGLTGYQGRLYGRISEILFNAWLEYKLTNDKPVLGKYMEIPIINTEKTKWFLKMYCFLKAIIFKEKYSHSF